MLFTSRFSLVAIDLTKQILYVCVQMIAKSSTDGTLFTRNWDIEPLFPLHIATSDKADQKYVLILFNLLMMTRHSL